MRPRASYLICATPRSGTTLLCDLLTQTGQAGAPQSYYRRQDMGGRAKGWGLAQDASVAFDRAYLDAVLRAGAGETDVFGLRLMWGTVGELCERLDRLFPEVKTTADLLAQAFGAVTYVHVSRQDKVAQAISLLRAEQSGLWHLAADGTERQRSGPAGVIGYDERRLVALVDELERDDAAWAGFFADAGVTPVSVRYEDLAVRPEAVVGEILQGLGCASTSPVAPRTARMADEISQAWRARFREERGR
ncbi:Stf0 family sulphotransferase [soil metagenome]